MPHNVFKIGIVVISKINYGRFFLATKILKILIRQYLIQDFKQHRGCNRIKLEISS